MENNEKSLSLFSEDTLTSLEMMKLYGGEATKVIACGAKIGKCECDTNEKCPCTIIIPAKYDAGCAPINPNPFCPMEPAKVGC